MLDSNRLEPARNGSTQHRRNMKRRRDDTKILDGLTQRHPGFGFNSSGCTVVRFSSGDRVLTTISLFDSEEQKKLEDRWFVELYNETACCPGRYCRHAIDY